MAVAAAAMASSAAALVVCARSAALVAPRTAAAFRDRAWGVAPRSTRKRRSFANSGRCYAAVLSREDREVLLMGVDPDNIEAVTKVLEQGRRAADRWEIAHSDFLPPPALSDSLMALRRTAELGIVVSGGYAEAERCRVSVGNVEGMTTREEVESSCVAAVSVAGNFKFDSAKHGDFLGAVLNTGIVRGKVGDIIVKGDEGAHVLLVPELVTFVCAAVRQVRGVTVETSPIPLSDLAVKPVRKDTMKTFEASMRVDAIASAGFRMSRSKLSDSISGGSLFINWKVVTKGGATVKSGDMISLRGKGRLEVGEVNSTKKGRYAVELFRYVQ